MAGTIATIVAAAHNASATPRRPTNQRTPPPTTAAVTATSSTNSHRGARRCCGPGLDSFPTNTPHPSTGPSTGGLARSATGPAGALRVTTPNSAPASPLSPIQRHHPELPNG